MFDFQEFLENLMQALSLQTPLGKKLRVEKVAKGPELWTGLMYEDICEEETDYHLCPVLYAEPLYKSYEKGLPFDVIVKQTIEVLNVSCTLKDFEITKQSVLDHVVYDMAGKGADKLYRKCPTKQWLDITVCYSVVPIDDNPDRFALRVTNDMMRKLQISSEELEAAAEKNTRQVFSDLLYQYTLGFDAEGSEEDAPFKVLGNCKPGGAAVILVSDTIRRYAVSEKKDLLLIPSSRNEWFIMPYSAQVDGAFLSKSIREVNKHDLSADEVLSDHAYVYERETNRFLTWDQYKEEAAAKEAIYAVS